MIIKNFSFDIDRRADGTAKLQLKHGGDTLTMELANEERQALALMLADPNFNDVLFEDTGSVKAD